MERVVIIGGGAAGMAAAITAAMCGDHVTVLERMDRVGKKILATGNGRCNLMNTGEWRYPGGRALAQAVLKRCGAAEQQRFWEHFGLRMRQEEDGRVYPVSGAASTVLDTLRQAMSALRVETITDCTVTALSREKKGWVIQASGTVYSADRVIVAGGGCAQPKLGSDGSTWKLLTDLGHRMVKARPALTQIITDTDAIRGLSGIRIRTEVAVTRGSRVLHREAGELLFADYGVTGVCVMQCARFAAPGDEIHMDMTKAMGFDSPDAFRQELHRRRKMWQSTAYAGCRLSQRDILTGLCVPKIGIALFRAAGIEDSHEPARDGLSVRNIEKLVQAAADLPLRIKGVKGFESAQVTAGGIAADEFDPADMSSQLVHGIHAAGEVLDVDGDCGGFNLMFAFGSGILAGLNGRPAPWENAGN